MALRSLMLRLRGRTFVGRDKYGNEFFFEKRELDPVPKRVIEYSKESDPCMVDVHDVPTEWRSWLNGQREHPPTEEEIALRDAKRALIQEKVKELEIEDARIRAGGEIKPSINATESEVAQARLDSAQQLALARAQKRAAEAYERMKGGSSIAGSSDIKPGPPSSRTSGNDSETGIGPGVTSWTP